MAAAIGERVRKVDASRASSSREIGTLRRVALPACHARSRRLRIEMGVVGDVEEKKGKGGLGYEKPEGKKKYNEKQ